MFVSDDIDDSTIVAITKIDTFLSVVFLEVYNKDI